VLAGPESAREVHELTQAAFGSYRWLAPPSGAIRETEDDVRRDLAAHGGVLGRLQGAPVGALRFVVEPRVLNVRRVAVDPKRQGLGVGRELMQWLHRYAAGRGFTLVRLGVRAELPGNRTFYEKLGYRVARAHYQPGSGDVHWYEMTRSVGEADASRVR
jgi:tRNA threonylcarbamoyladenosine biosynthesis protein TsaE